MRYHIMMEIEGDGYGPEPVAYNLSRKQAIELLRSFEAKALASGSKARYWISI